MLINLHRTLLCSQVTMALRSARRSYLKELDPIHHQSQRLILGAFRTFPINSLYAKAPEAPLQIRSEKLALQYYTKLKSCLSNPAHDCTVNPKYKKYFEKKKKKKQNIWPPDGAYSLRFHNFFNNIHKSILPQTPPWIIKKPKLILQLNEVP